jgi:hypothetical protein
MWRSFKAVKKTVNNSLNKRYINPADLASGRNESGLFDTIRQCYWDEEEKPEKLAVRERNKTYHEAKGQDVDDAAAETEEAKKSRPRATKTYEFESSWFPTVWLAFVMFGKPGKMKVLNSMSSGGTAISTTQRVLDRLATKREKAEQKIKTEKSDSQNAVSSEKSRTFTHNYVISKAETVETQQTVENAVRSITTTL